MQRVHLILKPLFWAALAFVFVLAVLPAAPDLSGNDKLNHMIAFFTLALLGAMAYSRSTLPRIALWLAAFGAAIEFAQMIPALHRDASLADWTADILAIALGLLTGALVRRRLKAG